MSTFEPEELSAADELIDRAASQIRASQADEEMVAAAADRVWGQLAGKYNARRGMKIVREDDPHLDEIAATTPAPQPASSSSNWRRWAMAAALIAGIGMAQFVIRGLWPAGPSATVQRVDGQLFRVASTAQMPIQDGTEILEDQSIRTGRDGGAVIRLTDGSLVEMHARSEISIDEGRGGTTIRLERGNVIVEAAKQRSKHLYVKTNECLVSVTGTIFSVNHGTKGSRVAVIEGEVKVDHGGEQVVLNPGDQVATHTTLAPRSVADEISWSGSADRYVQLLREFASLKRELRERLPESELRYDSRLLALMPDSTVIYAAAPNVGETIEQTHQIMQEQMANSPELKEWWATNAHQFESEMDRVIDVFGDFAGYFGREVAVGAHIDGDDFGGDDFGGALMAAEVVDAAGLRAFIEQKIDELQIEGVAEHLIFVEDPLSLTGNSGDNLYLWLTDDLAVGATSAEDLRLVASFVLEGATNPFVGSDFYSSIQAMYDEGAEFLVAADLHNLIGITVEGDGQQLEDLNRLGVMNTRHVLVEQKTQDQLTHHRLAVTFDEARQGIASWLAEPAPMGALGFISPDAKLVAAAVFKDPAKLLDDIFEMTGGEGLPSALREFEVNYGVSLRDDFAASLGGELAVALDGPVLPKPAWKVIIEVYDPARFQFSLEQALAEANTQLAAAGQEPLELRQETSSGRTYFTLPAVLMDVHYTFHDGYLLMAPSRALIDQAISYQSSGFNITESSRFASLLPRDGRNNFSALIYQDLASLVSGLAERLAKTELSDQQKAAIESIRAESKPTLGYAYGESERILVAATSDSDFLGSMLLRSFGMKDPAGMEAIFGGLFEGVF